MSLQIDIKRVVQQHSQELRHSLDFNEAVMVDVEMVPNIFEEISLIFHAIHISVRLLDFLSNRKSCLFVEEHASSE